MKARQQRQPSVWAKTWGKVKRKHAVPYLDKLPVIHYQSCVQEPGKPVWTPREYARFADEGYKKNVVAYRCISLIAQNVSCIPWVLQRDGHSVPEHPVMKLLASPNPSTMGKELLEKVISYRMISGNAYVLALTADNRVQELYALRPDRVRVIAGAGGVPAGYEYTVDKKVKRFPVDRITGRSPVLHRKHFNPLDDWYGMSPLEAAAYSIDQHNQAGSWNQALLQNGAKPSGALVVKMADDGSGGTLSDEQYLRVKQQVDEQYMGAVNAGRPLLLEGGMEWKEMSLSPRDMDFIQSKHSSARDIALAFGVPPQMLGIPGDNTYNNMAEARLALWEQTILPLLDHLTNALNHWLLPYYEEALKLSYDTDQISALSPRREKVWDRVKDADFLRPEEKRKMVGMKEED